MSSPRAVYLQRTVLLALLVILHVACKPLRHPQSEITATNRPASESGAITGWEEASSGSHSFRSLGKEFYEDLPVNRVQGARLVMFNFQAAKRLGLDIPEDPTELERIIVDRFGVFLSKDKKGERHMIATRYQDSGKKGPGQAMGDGRAVWSGEFQTKQPDGTSLYVDFVLKGVGQTPLAWTDHPDPGHKDGLQSMNEAIHSFILSETNFRNNIDSTIDLAVIELPYEKLDKHTGKKAKTAITVRIGNQTRIAHFKYFADSPGNFKKIFEYIVRRDLGLAPDAKIGREETKRYLKMLTTNLAEEAARYLDLNAVHSSPTAGNRTTKGSTIDMGTFRYLDANHGNYTYLFDQLELKGQTEQLRSYLPQVLYYLGIAKYPHAPDLALKNELEADFQRIYQTKLNMLWMNRLGIPPEAVGKLSQSTKEKFFTVVRSLVEAEGNRKIDVGGRNIKPAAYDVRKILASTLRVLAASPGAQEAEFRKIFSTPRSWGTLTPFETRQAILSYQAVVQEIMQQLNPSERERAEWLEHASLVNAVERLEPGRNFFELYEKNIVEMIQKNKNFSEISHAAARSVEALVDGGLPKREQTGLGRSQRIGVISGTFSPPHIGHHRVMRIARETLGLDLLYVIVNVQSDHKADVLSYDHRREMSKLAFRDKNIEVANAQLQEAFKAKDMNGVLAEIAKKHPQSEIFQIMGDDSFSRFSEVKAKQYLPSVTVVVNNRGSESDTKRMPPATIHPTIELPALGKSTSSTVIRKELAEGKRPVDLSEEVFRYIQTNKLYQPGSDRDAENISDFVAGGCAWLQKKAANMY